VTAASPVAGFRVSPQQRRLWSICAGKPHPLALAVVRLQGELQTARLFRAVADVVARHEILRTAFPQAAGLRQPVQAVLPRLQPRCRVADLGALPADRRPAVLARASAGGPPPTLDAGAPLEAFLVLLGEGSHRLLLRLPVAMSDERGLSNLVGEIAAAYAGTPPAECLQYADLAEVLNGLAESGDGAAPADWGVGGAEAPELPLVRPPVTPAGAEQGAVRRALGAESLRAVGELAAAEGVARPVVFLAAWQALLARLAGCERLPVAVAASGRAFEGLGEALGLFERLVPVVAELADGPSFRTICRRAATALAEAEDWQDGFDGGEAVPPFGFSHREPPPSFDADGLRFTVERTEAAVDRAGLWLEVREEGRGGELVVRFDRARFAGGEVGRLAERYACFLAVAAASPQRTLASLDLLLPQERRQLAEWNRSAAPAADASVPELFARQAARTPAAPAALCGDETLSYADLARRVGWLASRLRRLGVGPEDVVGVCLETSPDALVALLGVLASGGAFLPLDPSHPRERLAEIAAAAGAVAVVADRRSASSAPPVAGERPPLLVDELAEETPATTVAPIPPERLAYVLHTSGSTGRSKGVAVPHGALVNYMLWANRCLAGGEVQHLLALTRPSFDACLKQLFGPLLDGRPVCFLPGGTTDPAAVLAACNAEGSAVNCVPALWRSCLELVESGAAPPPRGLVRLLLGGESLDPQLLERTFAALPGVEVWNLYGPTETTANATAGRLLPGRPVDLGRPVANTQVHLLDAHLQPVVSGAAGEIFVGGEGVARGYLGQPGRTAERFVPDPFAISRGGRLYRTGDLGRFRGDGSLEFLGRTDRQVKLRGLRIEPGEVEALLTGHSAVAESAVELVDLAAAPALVALVVAAPGRELPDEAELLRWLGERAPAHLVPARALATEALPRLANGKLDRRAVAALAGERIAAACAPPAPPRNEVEERLAAIWREVLGVEEIRVDDNFFRLGGHSLSAIRLLSRIRSELEVDLPMQAVLEAPHLGALAARLSAAAGDGGDEPVDPIVAMPGEDWPLSLSEEKLWFLAQLDPETPAYNIPAALRLDGVLSAAALGHAFGEVTRRHAVLRSVFTASGGRPVRGFAPLRHDLPVADLKALRAEDHEPELLRLAEEEARRPFDLAAGPLLRRRLVVLAPGSPVLLFTLHHIVSDGWSTRILMRDLSTACAAFQLGEPSPLDEPALQYGDFARWQRRRFGDGRGEREAGFWRQRLAGSAEQVLVPDRERPAGPSTRGKSLRGVVPEPVVAALQATARDTGATLFMVLLAAFKVLLAAESGRRDICVGTDTANRERSEVQGLVGFFTNQFVLRSDLSGDPTFLELVGRVREVALGAYAHQELPFHQLVALLRPERGLGRTPLFQAMFSMQNVAAPDASLAGVPFVPLRAETASSVFDLSLYASEEEGRLALALRFNTDLFRTARMERLLERFGSLLARLADAPDERLEALVASLTEEDRRRLTDVGEELTRASAHRLDEVLRRRRGGSVPSIAAGGLS
jgi:amino acid adenylation domain-containing protein